MTYVPINYENCDTPEKLKALREFAATFEPPHEIFDNGNQIMIVKRGEEWIGYLEIVNRPLIFSAWSKRRCRPSDIVEAMKSFAGWAKIQHGSGMTTVPLNTTTFPEKIMNKLGFYRMGVELYGLKN